jgi:hypothetical protein
MPTGIIVNDVKDTIAVVLGIFEAAKHEVVYLSSPSFLSVAGAHDTMQTAKRFIEHGGVVRGITSISRANVEGARMRLDIGEDLRHSDQFHDTFMLIGDKQRSISSINIGFQEYTLDTPTTAFWSESPVYAEYLRTSFENAWSEAIPAEERIKELLEQG